MAEEMSRASTTIAYDGPAIAGGAMDVRDLAPALLALSQVCRAANRSLNGDDVEVTTYVRSDIRAGSFEVTIDLVMAAPGLIQSTLSSLAANREGLADAKQLMEIIGLSVAGVAGAGAGVFQFLKWLRGRKPEKVEPKPDGSTTIHIEGDIIVVSQAVFQLSQDADARQAIEGVVKPLLKTGIDSFEVREPGKPREAIATAADAFIFSAPLSSDEITGEVLADSETVTVLGVIRPHFESGQHRWGLHDGQSMRGYEMRDEVFLEKVANGVYKFGKGDALRVRLRNRTWRTPDNRLASAGAVIEVLEFLPAPKQQRLFPLPGKPEPPSDPKAQG